MDEKHPIAFVRVEIIEAAGLKPGDISGFTDPYVKGQVGPYRFTTKIQKKMLAPKWKEEFKIPISSWEAPNVLSIQVCDKDRMFNDALGECWININDYRGGQRHDKWLTLQNIKTGRLHLAITVLGESEKESNRGKSDDNQGPIETSEDTTPRSPWSSLDQNFTTFSSSGKDQKVSDEFNPISIEADQRKGMHVHHLGSDISKPLQPIKGGDGQSETKLHCEDSGYSNSSGSATSACSNGFSNNDRDADGDSRLPGHSIFRRGLQKISNKLHKHSKNDYNGLHGKEN